MGVRGHFKCQSAEQNILLILETFRLKQKKIKFKFIFRNSTFPALSVSLPISSNFNARIFNLTTSPNQETKPRRWSRPQTQ